MELRRIFNTKRILILLGILLINVVIFMSLNRITEREKIYVDLLEEYHDQRENHSIKDILKQYLDHNAGLADNENYKSAVILFKDKIEYIANYKTEIDAKLSNIEVLQNNSLFSEAGSKEYLELVKTKSDLNAVKNAEVQVDNGIWLEKVADYKYLYYFLAIGMFVVIYSFLEEKNGLIDIQYASANGRFRLLLKRVIIVAVFSLFYTFLLFGTVVIAAMHTYGGYESIFNAAASDEAFLLCSFGMSRFMWLIVTCCLAAFSIFAWSLLMWGVLSLYSNKNIGVYIVVMINAVEMILKHVIEAKSVIRILKYVNIFNLIEGNEVWFLYHNWGYSFFLTDVKESTVVIGIAAMVTGIVLLCINYVLKRPKHSMNFLESMIERLLYQMNRGAAQLPVWMLEIKKILIHQKAIWIIAVSVFILMNLNLGTVLKYDIKNSILYTFCMEHESDSLEELKELQLSLDDQYLLLENSVDKETQEMNMTIMEEKIKQTKYVIACKEVGKDVSMISQYKYGSLFNEKQYYNQEFIALLLIIIALFINDGVISYEKKKGVLYNIRASKDRKKWLMNKMLISSLITSAVIIGTYSYYYFKICKIYDIANLGYGIHSLHIFSGYPFEFSIKEVIIFDIFIKVLTINMIGTIGYIVSNWFSYEICFFVSAISLIPYILEWSGVRLFSYLSLPRIVAFYQMWMEGKIFFLYAAYLLIVVVGILNCFIRIRTFDHKKI